MKKLFSLILLGLLCSVGVWGAAIEFVAGTGTGELNLSSGSGTASVTSTPVTINIEKAGGKTQSRQIWTDGSIAKSEQAFQLSSNAGSDPTTKYVEITVASGYKITGLTIRGSISSTTAATYTAYCWTGSYSSDAGQVAGTGTFAFKGYNCTSDQANVSMSSIASNTRTIRLYKQVKYNSSTKTIGTGDNTPASSPGTLSIAKITVTYESTGPSISSFSPATGAKVKTGATITINGSTGSTVYYKWATSAQTADDIYNSGEGSHGTADAASASTTVESGKTLYAIARVGSTNSSVASASYTIDDTKPTFSLTTPASTTDVAVNTRTIVLTASENISVHDGVTNPSGTLKIGSADASAISYTLNDNTLSYTFAEDLALSTTYAFTVDADQVDDEAGNANAASSAFSFTTPAATAPTISDENQPENVSVLTHVEGTFSVVASGSPTPTYQWYSCDDAEKTNASPIGGATSDSYSVTKTTAGTYYYFVRATNSAGNIDSDVVTFTATARSGKELTKAVFSNTFDAFIDESGHTVAVYYMEGESTPTLSSYEASAYATAALSETTLTVTAEDETTQAYTVTFTSVAPYTTTGSVTFDGTETWIKTGYEFDDTKKWRFAKNADDGRIEKGKTRIYFFVGHANSLSLTTTTGQTPRNIKVYVNGVLDGTITKQADAGEAITITCNTNANNMVAIVSNQTGGDGCISHANLDNTVAISTATGQTYGTYVTTSHLDFDGVSGIKAYKITGVSGGVVQTSELSEVPSGTPILIETTSSGSTVNVPYASSTPATIAGNKLKAGANGIVSDESTYRYVLAAQDGVTGFYKLTSSTDVPSTKAYLELTSSEAVAAPSIIRIVDEENNATNINAIEAVDDAIKFIQDGKLFIKKNGTVYDMMGTIVK